MARKKNTSPALQYIHRRFFEGQPERLAELEEARASAEVARKVYALRTRAKLTQKELAARVGTTPSVISRVSEVRMSKTSKLRSCNAVSNADM